MSLNLNIFFPSYPQLLENSSLEGNLPRLKLFDKNKNRIYNGSIPPWLFSLRGEDTGAAGEDAGARSKERCQMKRLFPVLLIVVLSPGHSIISSCGIEEGMIFIKVSGNIEATEVDVGFKIAGRMVNLFSEEGDWIDKGKVIARIDDEDLRHRLELARASLMSAQARLDKLKAGSRPEELREAEAALHQAKYDLANKQNHFERMKPLMRGVIPMETLDNAEAAFKIAKASFQRAKENYASGQGGAEKRGH